jgi:hypothetical protein
MSYEINVSFRGVHFFATAERSVTSFLDLKKVFPVIRDKFPESEGYEISVTEYHRVGKQISLEELAF